jgi:hypothetical protein
MAEPKSTRPWTAISVLTGERAAVSYGLPRHQILRRNRRGQPLEPITLSAISLPSKPGYTVIKANTFASD